MTKIRGRRDVGTEKHATGCCRRGLLHLQHNKMSRLEENATGLVTKSIVVPSKPDAGSFALQRLLPKYLFLLQ